ncbi:hypothetical protein [Nocardioides sp. zg-DK7169]|uniref:hypothetical protein n=1 Tax=Nocardioides sp. zg-DK7169 TaxID=2736600 RepID=UPI001553B553|nr:hypothetical protein [Nocardioides sp. zg-DK7169]NPC95756.1 hypothetical protein [Nocardioides sp. zg-DK7169]
MSTPPPRARGRRTRWWWISGLALIVAAVGTFGVLVVTQFGGYTYWAEESAVPVDGRPHVVAHEDRALMLWTDTTLRTPTCLARDASGDVVPTAPTDDGYRRYGGAGDWVGTVVLSPSQPSGSIELTCSGLHPSTRGTVHVEPVPRLPAAVGNLGPLLPTALGLAGAGTLALLAAVLLAVRPRRR